MTPRFPIPEGGAFRLRGARVPAAMTTAEAAPDADGLAALDLWSLDGRIAFAGPEDAPTVEMAGCIALPAFVDIHTHLDKGHIWARRPNPDGTFTGALTSVRADREANWSARDVSARMEFALRSAWAHGTTAIRTHLDCAGPQTAISWGVFREARDRWAGRIALQAVCLTSIEQVGTPEFPEIANETARSGGVLGTVTYPVTDLDARLDQFFQEAMGRDLDVDFHVDETLDPESRTLRAIAEAKRRNGFGGAVLCGHCCSLSAQPEREALETIEMVAGEGVDVVSLPLCNLYLQDRHGARTPRMRGVTMVHELAAAGARVAFASDNTRDPFYAYGDLDMLEVMREATRIAHLDHPVGDWPAAFAGRAAAIAGFPGAGVIAEGVPADLVLFPARRWTELLARPHSDRVVIRGGRAIDARPPDYAELDELMEHS